MIEIGHNLGLAHSGESATYDDQSGMMGYSYNSDDGPNMCFNAPKNAQLGWYDDKLLTVSGTGWSGSLHGISDYESSDALTVIAKIPGSTEDWYVSFNRNTGINSGTQEAANRVLVHKRASGNGYAVSTLMAKLSADGTYNGAPLPITVNAITILNSNSFAQVTIGTTTAPTTNVSTFAQFVKVYPFLLTYNVLTSNFPSSSTSQQAPQLLPPQSLQLQALQLQLLQVQHQVLLKHRRRHQPLLRFQLRHLHLRKLRQALQLLR